MTQKGIKGFTSHKWFSPNERSARHGPRNATCACVRLSCLQAYRMTLQRMPSATSHMQARKADTDFAMNSSNSRVALTLNHADSR